MARVPNRPSPVPIAIVISVLTVALVALDMDPDDVRGIVTEMVCLVTGFLAGRSGQPRAPGE